MARSTKARVPEARSPKTRLPKYLNTDNIIEVSSDGVEDGSPSTQGGGTRRPMRSTRNQTSPPLYSAKYHPMDEVTRPAQAAKRRKVEIKEQTISSDEESPEDTLEELESVGRERSDDDQSSPPPRKPPTGTRHSGRSAARKRVSYDAKVHPQDRQLEELGIKRKRASKKEVIADSQESDMDGEGDGESVQSKSFKRGSKQLNETGGSVTEVKAKHERQPEENHSLTLTFDVLSRMTHRSSTPVLQERYAEPVDVHRLPPGQSTFDHYRDSLVNKDDAGSIETQSLINVFWESDDEDNVPTKKTDLAVSDGDIINNLLSSEGPERVADSTANVPNRTKTDDSHAVNPPNPSSGSSRTLGGDRIIDEDVFARVPADGTGSRQTNVGGSPSKVEGDGVTAPANAGGDKATGVPSQTSMEDEIATVPSNALSITGAQETETVFKVPSLGASSHEERGVFATKVAQSVIRADDSQAIGTSSQCADAVVEAALNAAESLAFLDNLSATAATQHDTMKGMSGILRQKPQQPKRDKKVVGFVIHEDPKTPEKSGGLRAARSIYEDFEKENTPRSPGAAESPLRPRSGNNSTSANGNHWGLAEHSSDTAQDTVEGGESIPSLQRPEPVVTTTDENASTPSRSSDAATTLPQRFPEEVYPGNPTAVGEDLKVVSLFGPYGAENGPQSRPSYADENGVAPDQPSQGLHKYDDLLGKARGFEEYENTEDLFDDEGTSGFGTSSQSNHFEEAIAAGSDPSSELNRVTEGVMMKESQEL